PGDRKAGSRPESEARDDSDSWDLLCSTMRSGTREESERGAYEEDRGRMLTHGIGGASRGRGPRPHPGRRGKNSTGRAFPRSPLLTPRLPWQGIPPCAFSPRGDRHTDHIGRLL